MSQPSDPSRTFNIPPQAPVPQPAPASSSNRTLLLILGILGGGVVLCACAGIVLVGVLSVLGQRVETSFAQINSGLEQEAAFVLPTAQPIDATQALRIDQLIQAGDLDVQIVGTHFDPGTGTVRPEPGNQFLVIDLQVTNRSRRSLVPDYDLSSGWVQDDANTIYSCCVYGLVDTEASEDPIRSGETTTMSYVYEVPRTTGDLFWVYEEYYDEQQVAVKLQ